VRVNFCMTCRITAAILTHLNDKGTKEAEPRLSYQEQTEPQTQWTDSTEQSPTIIYIFISPQMVDNKQYEKKNKNKQK